MRRTVLALFVFSTLLVCALATPLPKAGRNIGCAGDMLHVAAFAILAVLVYRLVQRRVPKPSVAMLLACWFAIMGFGVLTEYLQSTVGRNASLQDVLANACGAAGGLLWMRGSALDSRRLRLSMYGIGCFVMLVGAVGPLIALADSGMQQWEMPVLASFEQPLEMSRWSCLDCRMTRVQHNASLGTWALRVDLDLGKYPGIKLKHPVPNWSTYDSLVLDVFLPTGPELDLVLKIEDWEHNLRYDDRFHQTVHLKPGWNAIHVDLAAVATAPRGRMMDLCRVNALSLFAVDLDSPRTLYLDNVHLSRQDRPPE